jgi:competence protein ComEA
MISDRPGGLARFRVHVGLGAVVVLLLVGLAVAVVVSALSAAGTTRTLGASAPSASAADGGPAGAPASGSGVAIFVHVLGAVERPGLYQLHDGDRAVDAVAAAGGFTATADQQQVNLARRVADGEALYLPAVGEAAAAVGAGAPLAGGKVNLNTADATALEGLPRVGPAMAERIIAWRTANGRFAAVEDLLSVTGIGEKTFAQLRDLVTV